MSKKQTLEISEDMIELILERLDVMPSNFKLSIGNDGTFTKEQLKESVKRGDKTGESVIQMELNFIKALTSGELIKTLNQSE